jgi:hypothetical protein
MIPRLDAREVAAVFSAPFYNFLKEKDLPSRPGEEPHPPGAWYEGAWVEYKDTPWRSHSFFVPVNNQRVSKPRRASTRGNLAETLDEAEAAEQEKRQDRFKVWGMTGRVLVDAARVSYGEDPEMEHNASFGDLDVIERAKEEGQFEEAGEQRREGGSEPAKM